MTAKLVKLMGCRDAIEAETIRNRLETAGIMAVVQGAEVGTALSYVGVALGFPNIEVQASDLQRAREILAADREALLTAGAWTCCRCGEYNEPAFEVCWSCNKTRAEEDGRAMLDPHELASYADSGQHSDPLVAPTSKRNPSDVNNPYQPIDFADRHPLANVDGDLSAAKDNLEHALDRAFVASLLGASVPIMIFSVYSILILVRLAYNKHPSINTKPKTFFATWVINLAVIAFTLTFLLAS